jgi:alanyl-tRNA synthetase
VLTVVGHTPEGKRVLRGVFWFPHTHGIPLDIIVDLLTQHDCVVDWEDYYRTGRSEGVSARTLQTRIVQALQDAGQRTAAEMAETLFSAFEERLGVE